MWGPRAGQVFFNTALGISSWPGALLLVWKMARCASPIVAGGKDRVVSELLSLQSTGTSSAEAAFWRRVFTRSSALESEVVWTVSPFLKGGIGKDHYVLFHLI